MIKLGFGLARLGLFGRANSIYRKIEKTINTLSTREISQRELSTYRTQLENSLDKVSQIKISKKYQSLIDKAQKIRKSLELQATQRTISNAQRGLERFLEMSRRDGRKMAEYFSTEKNRTELDGKERSSYLREVEHQISRLNELTVNGSYASLRIKAKKALDKEIEIDHRRSLIKSINRMSEHNGRGPRDQEERAKAISEMYSSVENLENMGLGKKYETLIDDATSLLYQNEAEIQAKELRKNLNFIDDKKKVRNSDWRTRQIYLDKISEISDKLSKSEFHKKYKSLLDDATNTWVKKTALNEKVRSTLERDFNNGDDYFDLAKAIKEDLNAKPSDSEAFLNISHTQRPNDLATILGRGSLEHNRIIRLGHKVNRRQGVEENSSDPMNEDAATKQSLRSIADQRKGKNKINGKGLKENKIPEELLVTAS